MLIKAFLFNETTSIARSRFRFRSVLSFVVVEFSKTNRSIHCSYFSAKAKATYPPIECPTNETDLIFRNLRRECTTSVINSMEWVSAIHPLFPRPGRSNVTRVLSLESSVTIVDQMDELSKKPCNKSICGPSPVTS
jgi:hypothetical protein